MNSPRDKILAEIRRDKVISFARFMELALYCPNVGFYEQEADNIGRRGDYFTSVSVGRVFGELLAFQFAIWIESEVQSPKSRVRLIEAGAHNGQLAKDILSWLRECRRTMFHRLEYFIIEPSATRRRWQKEQLSEFESKTRWVNDLADLATANSLESGDIIFSNEFLDALPVRRFRWNARDKRWIEWGVGESDSELVWKPLGEAALHDFGLSEAEISRLANVLPDGFTVDFSASAIEWWRRAARFLRRGKLLTIDYGLAAEELFLPHRHDGTLRSYRKHHLSSDVLTDPGRQDITAHVNFSALRRAGEDAGLKTDAFVTQEKFFADVTRLIERNPHSFLEWTSVRARQLQTLISPEHLGRRFSVLVQSRD